MRSQTMEAKGRVRRVLLVEDDRLTRTVLKECLRQVGFEVECAPNGEVALDRLDTSVDRRNHPIDLVLTDIYMPKINGESLIRAITLDPRYGRVPVAVMSSDDSKDAIQRVLDMGAIQYIVKPASREQLSSLRHCVGSVSTLVNPEGVRSPAPVSVPSIGAATSGPTLPLLEVVGLCTDQAIGDANSSRSAFAPSFRSGQYCSASVCGIDATSTMSAPGAADAGQQLSHAAPPIVSESLHLPDTLPAPGSSAQPGGEQMPLSSASPYSQHLLPPHSSAGQIPFILRSASAPPLDTDSIMLSQALPLQSAASMVALRKAALERFRAKKAKRQFAPKVRYVARKKLAEARPRFKGQFVKASSLTVPAARGSSSPTVGRAVSPGAPGGAGQGPG